MVILHVSQNTLTPTSDSASVDLQLHISEILECKLRGVLQSSHLYSVSVKSSLFTGGGEDGTSLTVVSLFSAGEINSSLSGSSISARQANGLGELNWLVTISSYCSSSDEL